MAKEKLRQISPEDLIVILKEHHLWLESGQIEGKRANLQGANLQGAELYSAQFQGANLQDANLQGAQLQLANLQGANLQGAELYSAKFQEANLQGADLQGAYLYRAQLQGTYLQGADLQGAYLYRAQLQGTYLQGADLQGAYLYRAQLQGAKLQEANLQGAQLQEAELQGANLEGVNLRDAYLSDAGFVGANLCHVKTAGADFKSADLKDIRIDKATVSLLPQEVVNLYGKTFFILGYTDDLNKVIRSIEFPPEYHQAGISILNYFGTVLRKKYPDQKAKFRIEQEERKVTMIIVPEEGDREIIEKYLDEYGLVITGQMTPEQFTDDRQLLMELKTELRVAQVRIESQKDIIEYQRSDLTELQKLLDTGLRHPPPIQNIINVKIAPQINLIHGSLNELKEKFPEISEEAKSISEIQEGLGQIENASTLEEVAKTSAMSKFRRFLDNVEKAETTAGKVIKTTKDGIDIARKLAGQYNQIAQWCGLPQVPEPFTKK